jgi:hypothetical protein
MSEGAANNIMEQNGLYFLSSLSRMLLNNAPRLIWGETPHTNTGRLLSWSAPLLSNMMGMFINMKMRDSTISENKQGLQHVEAELRTLKAELKKVKEQATG